MDASTSQQPRHLRWWGTIAIAYVAITAVLGVAFLVSSRSRPSIAATDDAIRIGGFTASQPIADSQKPIDGTTTVLPISDTDPSIGASAASAKLTIVEFSDFQCPFCRQAFPIIRSAAARYGDRGLRYVYRDFFDEELHANARLAAEAARCAHAQGKFWAYHDKLFQNQDELDVKSLATYARQVGLDGQQFDVCLASKQFATTVQSNVDAGIALGVRGTPTWFFIPSGVNALTRRVEGVIPQEKLTDLLEERLPKK